MELCNKYAINNFTPRENTVVIYVRRAKFRTTVRDGVPYENSDSMAVNPTTQTYYIPETHC